MRLGRIGHQLWNTLKYRNIFKFLATIHVIASMIQRSTVRLPLREYNPTREELGG